METKNPGIKESKARIEGGSAAAMRPSTSLSLSAGLYGLVLAVKGSASPRFAPWTAPGRAWGLAGFKRERGELLQRGGRESTRTRLRKGAVLQPSGTARASRRSVGTSSTCSLLERTPLVFIQSRWDASPQGTYPPILGFYRDPLAEWLSAFRSLLATCSRCHTSRPEHPNANEETYERHGFLVPDFVSLYALTAREHESRWVNPGLRTAVHRNQNLVLKRTASREDRFLRPGSQLSLIGLRLFNPFPIGRRRPPIQACGQRFCGIRPS